jgi:hypothetical protein
VSRIEIIRDLLSGRNEKLLEFLFPSPDEVTDQNGEMDLERIENGIGALSSGEQILCRVAMDIWGEYGKVQLFDICRRLDEGNFRAVMNAMEKFRNI